MSDEISKDEFDAVWAEGRRLAVKYMEHTEQDRATGTDCRAIILGFMVCAAAVDAVTLEDEKGNVDEEAADRFAGMCRSVWTMVRKRRDKMLVEKAAKSLWSSTE